MAVKLYRPYIQFPRNVRLSRQRIAIFSALRDFLIIVPCKSYLTGRTFTVLLSGKISQAVDVTCSVPQGSVLGPLLFTLYTADLADLASVEFYLYPTVGTVLIHSIKPELTE